jgi:hypothetical protein
MNRTIANFIDRLAKVKDKFIWEINTSHKQIKQIIGHQNTVERFCPMSAVLYGEKEVYILPEQFIKVGLKLGLSLKDISIIVDSVDGHGDKYDAYVRYQIFNTIFNRKETNPPFVSKVYKNVK